jgi:hypothetical protein
MVEAWYRTKEWLKIVQQQAAFEQVENRQGRTCWLRRKGIIRHSDSAIVFVASLGRGKPILASRALMSIWGLCLPAPRLSCGGGGQACLAGLDWLDVQGKQRLKATSKPSSFGRYFP